MIGDSAAKPPFCDSQPSALNQLHCRSYSPLLIFLSTVNPAFFASEMDNGLSLCGELKVEMILRTGFLHAGQFVSGLAESGRFNVNFPPQTTQWPSHSSYS
jgi:hypothetical protein